jgi:hypothetical protein
MAQENALREGEEKKAGEKPEKVPARVPGTAIASERLDKMARAATELPDSVPGQSRACGFARLLADSRGGQYGLRWWRGGRFRAAQGG